MYASQRAVRSIPTNVVAFAPHEKMFRKLCHRHQVRTRRRFLLRVSAMNARRATILPYVHCVLLGEQRRVHYAPSLEEECSCILPSCSLVPTGMSGSTSTRIRRVLVRWDVVHSKRTCIAENRVSPKEQPCDGRLAHVVCIIQISGGLQIGNQSSVE